MIGDVLIKQREPDLAAHASRHIEHMRMALTEKERLSAEPLVRVPRPTARTPIDPEQSRYFSISEESMGGQRRWSALTTA